MLADSHIHSFFSEDSSSSIENIAENAALHRLDYFTITDHYELWNHQGYTFDVQKRIAILSEKKKVFPCLLIGVEVGEPQANPNILHEWRDLPFDLFLGAIHTAGDLFGPHSDPTHPDETIYMAYFTQVKRMVETTDIDAVAHLDFPRRYLLSYFIPWDIVESILRIIVERAIAVEINTSMWRRGVSWSMPDMALLQRYRELGGKRVILGSDAHNPSDVGSGIARGAQLARDLDLTPGFYRNHVFTPL